MTQLVTCGGCPATWTGLSIAHCKSCHQTFTNPRAFDAHRAAQSKLGEPREVKTRKGTTETRQKRIEIRPAGECYDPADSGLALNERGYWSYPPGDYWEKRVTLTVEREEPTPGLTAAATPRKRGRPRKTT